MHIYLHRTRATTHRGRDSAIAVAVAVAYRLSTRRRWLSPAGARRAQDQDRLHEIRATVGGIAAAHEVLRRADDLPMARRKQLEQLCEHEVARLTRLVDTEVAARPSEVDLDDTIGLIVETLRVRGHRVTWHGSDTVAWGHADDIAEIVHILLQNAVKHGAGEDVAITTVPRGAYVAVHVRDSGPGVLTDLAPRVFERGVRRTGSPGDGLGLSIARDRATQMGGRLRLARHTPGQVGAEFVLTLPAAAGRRQACLEASR